MSKRTPGPWTAKTSGMTAQVVCPDGRYFLVGDAIYHPENKANALLIAAAPDLLEALKGLLRTCEQLAEQQEMTDDFWKVDAHISRLAIAKAEGQ